MDFDDLDEAVASSAERVFNLDEEDVPRGSCKCCDCSEWFGWTTAESGRQVPGRRRAYCITVPTKVTVKDLMDDAQAGVEVSWRTLATLGGQVQVDQGEDAALQEAPPGCCRRCGCPAKEHFDLSSLASRLLSNGALAEAAADWDDLERSLFAQTQGGFLPRGGHDSAASRGPRGLRSKNGQILVSVICPTSSQRQAFHPCLYQHFCQQSHPSKELVVVDTCEGGPSEFFERGPPARDPRVIYRHFDVPARAWSVGAKRNVACRLAHGAVICHFDDDDLYGPEHVARGVRAMQQGAAHDDVCVASIREIKGHCPGLAAEAAALSSWFTFDLDSGDFAVGGDRQGSGKDRRPRKRWSFGWGFSHMYLWDAWRARWFRDVTQGEDGDFLDGLLARGWRIAVFDDWEGQCAHTHHGTNTSFRERQTALPPGALERSPLPGMGAALRSTVQD